MEELKITHTKNTREEEIGHGLGGTVVLDGTGGPCYIAAWACLNALNFTPQKSINRRVVSNFLVDLPTKDQREEHLDLPDEEIL